MPPFQGRGGGWYGWAMIGAVLERQDKLPVIGWREWVLSPGLLELPLKAKIDSGARTSSVDGDGRLGTGTMLDEDKII